MIQVNTSDAVLSPQVKTKDGAGQTPDVPGGSDLGSKPIVTTSFQEAFESELPENHPEYAETNADPFALQEDETNPEDSSKKIESKGHSEVTQLPDGPSQDFKEEAVDPKDRPDSVAVPADISVEKAYDLRVSATPTIAQPSIAPNVVDHAAVDVPVKKTTQTTEQQGKHVDTPKPSAAQVGGIAKTNRDDSLVGLGNNALQENSKLEKKSLPGALTHEPSGNGIDAAKISRTDENHNTSNEAAAHDQPKLTTATSMAQPRSETTQQKSNLEQAGSGKTTMPSDGGVQSSELGVSRDYRSVDTQVRELASEYHVHNARSSGDEIARPKPTIAPTLAGQSYIDMTYVSFRDGEGSVARSLESELDVVVRSSRDPALTEGSTLQNVIKPPPAKNIIAQISQTPFKSNVPSMVIQLHPEELGQLTYSVTDGDGGITITVSAEKSETLDLLKRNQDDLLAEFTSMGFDGANLEFESSSDDENYGDPERDGIAFTDENAPGVIPQGHIHLISNARIDVRF